MTKVMFVCNTYYQLIIALQCKNTLFHSACVDIIVSNHSKNADVVARRLAKLELFNRVVYFKSKKIDQGKHGVIEVVSELFSAVFGWNRKLSKMLGHDIYDELVYYNLNSSISQIYAILERRNKSIKCSRFEEGIVSYNNTYNEKGRDHYTKRLDITFKIRKRIGKQCLVDNCNSFYCFFPDYYKGVFKATGIPLIKENDVIRNQLAEIFNITDNDYIIEKYIFFTSVYDFEGENQIGEFDVVNKVAELVGMENFIVKTHPRDTRDVYDKNGIKTVKTSSVPWEALQLRFGYQDKVLLTTSSGSIISTNMMVSSPIDSYYLFDECKIDKNELAEHTVKEIKKILSDKKLSQRLKTVHAVKTIKEILG